jgi:hypothetical protein
MSKLTQEEIDAINLRIEERALNDKIETDYYWQNTYPALPYEERKKVWLAELWFMVRNGPNNLDYINQDYLNILKEKEPDIVKIYDEILRESDWLEDIFEKKIINITRERITATDEL